MSVPAHKAVSGQNNRDDHLRAALAEIAEEREWGHYLKCGAPNVCKCADRLREIARKALDETGSIDDLIVCVIGGVLSFALCLLFWWVAS